MTDEDRQYKEKMKNGIEQLNDKAEEKAKKERIKKIIKIIGIKGIAIGIVIAITAGLLSVVFFAAALDFNDCDTKTKATSAKAEAFGDEALDTILTLENGSYKINYDGKTGKDAIEAKLEDANMNFEDFNDNEINCLYNCLKAEWATTYPNLGGSVDNKDVDSDYVQGVITFSRESKGGNRTSLTYVPYEEFQNKTGDDALKYFSMKDGNIIIYGWSSYEVKYDKSSSMPDDIKAQYNDIDRQITLQETTIDYKSMIGIHTVPFELLLSLLVNTEDVDFVNDLADLAFDSTIEITIYDNTTKTTTVETVKTTEVTEFKKIIEYTTTGTSVSSGDTMFTNFPVTEYINSKDVDRLEYTLTTTTTNESNSYIIGLTSVKSWIANISNKYEIKKEDKSENLGTQDAPIEEGTYDLEPYDIYTGDREVLNFQSTKTYDVENLAGGGPIHIECVINSAKKQGTMTRYTQLTKNESTTTKWSYEAGNKQVSEVGEQFAEVYDKHPKAQGNLDTVASWLFDLLDDTESTVDYVSIMKYLLFVCTGDSYGVTEDDILELLESNMNMISVSKVNGNILAEYIKRWENYSLADYMNGEGNYDSVKKYVTEDRQYYKSYYVNSVCNFSYGLSISAADYTELFKKFGLGDPKNYFTEGSKAEVDKIDSVYAEVILNMRDLVVNEVEKAGINLTSEQIDALTVVRYQWGNIGNFSEAYKNANGDMNKFKESFFVYNADRSKGWPYISSNGASDYERSRKTANFKLFSEGIYTDIHGNIIQKGSGSSAGSGDIFEMLTFGKKAFGKDLDGAKRVGVISSNFSGFSGAWCSVYAFSLYEHAGFITLEEANSLANPEKGLTYAGYWQRMDNFKHYNGYVNNRVIGDINYKPQPGDLILYSDGTWNTATHVGVIYEVTGSAIKTIEGNSTGGKCAIKSRSNYKIGFTIDTNWIIMGYFSLNSFLGSK